jgi:cell wall-associated NlpC family hydrolase
MLSDVGDAVTGGLAVVGRSGAVLAASTGLLATVGLPAQAQPTRSVSEASAPVASTGAAARFFSAPVSGARLSAPMAATVQFETSAFVAEPVVPRPVVAPATPVRSRPADRAAASTKAVARKSVATKAAPTTAAPRRAGTSTHSGTHQAVPAKAAPARPKAPRAKHRRAATAPAKSSRKTTRPPASDSSSSRSVRGSEVLAIAARYVGVPYVYGGTSPHGFDCSGYTGYVYRQLGISLPRTANQQMQATRRVSRSQARAGDLVFFVSGGRAYHVGIYAGGGKMYAAPHTGERVQKEKIWDASAVYGRVSR